MITLSTCFTNIMHILQHTFDFRSIFILTFHLDPHNRSPITTDEACYYESWLHSFIQGLFCVCAQPVRDGVRLMPSGIGLAHTQNNPCLFLEHVHKIPLQCLFILDELAIRSHVRKSIPVNWHEFSGIDSDCLVGVYLRKNNLKKTLLGKKNFPTLLLIGWQYSHQPVRSHFGKSVWNDKIYLTQLLIS